MTRINVGIDPKELPGPQLLAEHREITRIPNAIHAGRFSLSSIPDQFKLGEGHVTFFYNKLAYLARRYHNIYWECRARGYEVADKFDAFENLPPALFKEYVEQPRDRELLLERFQERGIELLQILQKN